MPYVIAPRVQQPSRGSTLLEGLNGIINGFQAGQQQSKQLNEQSRLRQQQMQTAAAQAKKLEAETKGLNLTNDARGGLADALSGVQLPNGLQPDQFGRLLNSGGEQKIGDILGAIDQGNARAGAVDALGGGDYGIASALSSIGAGEAIDAPFTQNAAGLSLNQFSGDQSASNPLAMSSVAKNNADAFKSRQAGLLDQQKTVNAQNGVIDPVKALQREKLQLEVEDLNAERAQAQRMKQNAINTAVSRAENVLQTVDQAKSLVGPSTTGALGAITSQIPGFDGFNLSQKVDTIRASLGIDELLRIKKEGGTLGALSDTELNVLQNSIANLNQAQSQEEFSNQLGVVENQYRRLISSLQDEGGISPQQQPNQAQQSQPAMPEVGAVMDGYQFLGGDPSNPNSWRPVSN